MLALLLACVAPDPVASDDTPTGVLPDDEPDPTETVGPAPEGSGPGACHRLYDPDVLQAFEVDISEAEWAALLEDYARGEKDYHPVVFRRGDEVVEDAHIRLKGNPDFSWFDGKMQYVIAFDQADPDARFHGLRKIALDASWYEPTMLRDRVAWSMLRRAGGVPTACANSATLTINGEYHGLYTNIEFFDHEWLERNFGDEEATGTLWKYGTEPVSNAEASTGAAVARMHDTTDPTALAELGDLDEWLHAWAAEVVVGTDDGYVCCDHNYYLYEHPTRGILFVPWDLDDAFDVQGYDTDPVDGYGAGLFQEPHFRALTADPTWGPRYVDAVAAVNAAMEPDTVIAEMDAWQAQIADALLADPNRSIGWEEHLASTERMRAWVRARHAYLDRWVACQRGETTDADGDGAPVCADPHDGDATIHPSATEVCNGVDDDADGWIDDDPACDDCVRHDFDGTPYLFCRWPRTNAEAAANCVERGASLAGPATTNGEYYLYFFYTWPVRELWWTGENPGGGRCPGWDEAGFEVGTGSCDESHPSICSIR